MGAAAGIMMGVGTALQVYGTIQAGEATAAAAKYNAEIAKQNATIALQQADADADAFRRQATKIIGGVRAGYGASGVSGGSVEDVIADSSATAELDRQNILYQGRLRAMGFQSEATLYKFQARQAITQSRLGAASQLLTGGAKAISMLPSSAPATPTT